MADAQALAASDASGEIRRTLVTQDGAIVGYRRWTAPRGEGNRVLLLLHGMASNLTRWSEFVEHTQLKESWDIVRVDLRGHGESFSRGPIGMRVWCDDLRALLDAEGYEQALPIGHSLGAQVAVQFAHRYPEHVCGLVLIDPVFHQALRGGMWWLSQLKPLVWMVIAVVRFLNLVGLRRRHIPSRDLRRLDERTRAALLDAGKQREMIRYYSSPWPDLKHFPTAHYLQELLEIIRPLPPLETIDAPTLVLLSKGVTYTDPELTRRMIARLPDAEVGTVDAYHWPLTEKPVEVRQAIEHWCARLVS